MNIDEKVEAYLNGNFVDTKKFLKKCSKFQLLEFVYRLDQTSAIENAILRIQKLLY